MQHLTVFFILINAIATSPRNFHGVLTLAVAKSMVLSEFLLAGIVMG